MSFSNGNKLVKEKVFSVFYMPSTSRTDCLLKHRSHLAFANAHGGWRICLLDGTAVKLGSKCSTWYGAGVELSIMSYVIHVAQAIRHTSWVIWGYTRSCAMTHQFFQPKQPNVSHFSVNKVDHETNMSPIFFYVYTCSYCCLLIADHLEHHSLPWINPWLIILRRGCFILLLSSSVRMRPSRVSPDKEETKPVRITEGVYLLWRKTNKDWTADGFQANRSRKVLSTSSSHARC